MATTQFITEYDLGLNVATKLDDRIEQYEEINGEQAEAIILGEAMLDLLNAYLAPHMIEVENVDERFVKPTYLGVPIVIDRRDKTRMELV